MAGAVDPQVERASHIVTIPRILMPSRGDRCWVAFDENERPVILVWEPA